MIVGGRQRDVSIVAGSNSNQAANAKRKIQQPVQSASSHCIIE